MPLGHVAFLVREETAAEVSGIRSGIEDLDPVGGVAIAVKARAPVISHKFRDVEDTVRGWESAQAQDEQRERSCDQACGEQ